MKIGLLTSVGLTLDSFFPQIVDHWEKDHQVFTAAGTKSSVGNFQLIPSLSRRPAVRNIFAPRQISQWAQQHKLDVVLANTATAAALARSTKMDVPVVYFCHGLHWNETSAMTDVFWKFAERFLFGRTAGLIVINSFDESWFSRHRYSGPRLRLTQGVGLDLEEYPVAPLPEGEGLALVWAGEFSHRKRPVLALKVIDRLRSMHVEAKLTMLGDGPLLESTKTQVDAMGLSDHVSLPGRMQVQPAFERAHALLHTAEWEGLPRIGLEAVAMGRPVFGFDVKGVSDLPGVVLADDGDVERLSDLIARHAENCNFTPSVHTRDFLDYRSVADSISKFMEQFDVKS